MLELENTDRGFAIARFTDRYGKACHIQKSSLAFEDCIWLGADKIELKEFTTERGWVDRKEFDEPNDTGHSYIANTCMHLTREQVKDLLPLLQRFVDTGELEEC